MISATASTQKTTSKILASSDVSRQDPGPIVTNTSNSTPKQSMIKAPNPEGDPSQMPHQSSRTRQTPKQLFYSQRSNHSQNPQSQQYSQRSNASRRVNTNASLSGIILDPNMMPQQSQFVAQQMLVLSQQFQSGHMNESLQANGNAHMNSIRHPQPLQRKPSFNDSSLTSSAKKQQTKREQYTWNNSANTSIGNSNLSQMTSAVAQYQEASHQKKPSTSISGTQRNNRPPSGKSRGQIQAMKAQQA